MCWTLSWIQLITRTQKEAAFIYKPTPERPKHEPSRNRKRVGGWLVGRLVGKNNAQQAKLCGAKPKKLLPLRGPSWPPPLPLPSPPPPTPTLAGNYFMLFENESEVQLGCRAVVGCGFRALGFRLGNCLICEITLMGLGFAFAVGSGMQSK